MLPAEIEFTITPTEPVMQPSTPRNDCPVGCPVTNLGEVRLSKFHRNAC
jgi:hypothetical protein